MTAVDRRATPYKTIATARAKADMLQSCHAIWVLPEHIWSKIPPQGGDEVNSQNLPPMSAAGPFQVRRVEEGRLPDPWRPTRTTGGRRPRSTR